MGARSADPRIGTEIAGYRIEALLGRGGMSVVYLAEDLRLHRKVALKLIAPELAQDERFRARFLAESELAASLDHPNVVPIYEAGEAAGVLFIAMRYVEGEDLKQLLGEGPMPRERVIALCTQIAAALDAAHARDLVHRDVKPSNVLIDRQAGPADHVYLADFGLTRRLTEQGGRLGAGLSLGTPAYIAPEQIEGAELDGRADQYSLGCLLFECLTGQPPFAHASDAATLFAHLDEQPPSPRGRRPELPEAIDAVLATAMAKKREERFATCRQLVEEAHAALGIGKPAHRWRTALMAAVAGAALVAAGLLAFFLVRGDGAPALRASGGSLVRIDPKTSKISAVIHVGRGPRAVAVGGQTVWVYNGDDHTVSAIDPKTNAIEQTVSISSSTLELGAQPLVADGDGAWVVGFIRGKGVLTRIRLGAVYQPQYFFDYDPLGVALGEGAVWVAASGLHGSAVLRISPKTGAILGKVPFRAGSFGTQLNAIAVGQGAVWVMSKGGTLFRIDPETARMSGKAGARFGELSFVAAGYGSVWVGDWQTGRLVRVDPRTLRATATIPQPGEDSGGLAFADGSVWWGGQETGTVWRVDPREGKIVSTIRLTPSTLFLSGLQPTSIATGAGGVWVTVGTQV